MGLRHVLQGHLIPEAFKGLHRPLLLLVLLSRLEVLVPCLLIERPLSEEVIDDHQNFMGDGHGGFLAPQAPFETPERPAQIGRRFAGAPGTLYQDPSEIPVAPVCIS